MCECIFSAPKGRMIRGGRSKTKRPYEERQMEWLLYEQRKESRKFMRIGIATNYGR